MNEQELPNLHSLLTTGEVSVMADSNPRIAGVLDQMREVYSLLSRRQGEGRAVSRIHLHTLAYQASLTAKGHVCADPEVRPENSFLIMDDSFATSGKEGAARVPFDDSRPLTCWEEEELGVEICLAP